MSTSFEDTTSLRLQRLIQANQALAQVESLQDLLPQLLRFAQEVTNAEASSILLYKPETQTLEFTLAYNEQEGTAENIIKQNIELPLGEGIAGCVASTRQSIIVRDARADKRFFKKVDKMSGFQTKSIVCTPILYQEELLGVVQVLNAKDKAFFDDQDLLILESFSHLAAVAMVRSRMLEAMLKQERMQAQLDAAARIQNNFLPRIPDIGKEHQIYAVTQPAIFVGGDFYDIIPCKDRSVLFCVADVSGKGLPAALIGATLWTTLRSLYATHQRPAELLGALNSEVYHVLAQQMFATMVLCRYWPKSGRALLALAGHIPPLCISKNSIKKLSPMHGHPIGIDKGDVFSEIEITLDKHDSLVMISDGVVEARNCDGDFYGEKNVTDILTSRKADQLTVPRGRLLLEDVIRWRGMAEQNDDMTIVEVWHK